MLSLLGVIEQCLKTGKKQPWHAASVTNICVGLLAGFKVMIMFSYLLVCLFEMVRLTNEPIHYVRRFFLSVCHL